jgi:hypothetical protein
MKRLFNFLLLFFISISSFAQCPNNNVIYNVSATPGCPGSTTVGCVWGGEYVLVDVVAGNTYTFSTCGATWDTQITLFNNTGGVSLGYNDDGCGLQSTITWTATFTGQLRVLVDQYDCTSNFSCAGLTVSCTPGTPPTGDCVYILNLYDSWGDGWGSGTGTSNVGVSINGGPYTYYSVSISVNSIPIGLNVGDIIVLNYNNNSGPNQEDNSYTLTMGGGLIFSSGNFPPDGISYAGNVTCDPPPSPPEDCLGAITICSDQSFNNTTTNTGNNVDLNASNYGCLMSAERQGTWYVFSPATSGSIGFTIDPVGPDDYDFALWGPFPLGTVPSSICPPIGPPMRCSFASGPSTFGATGDYDTGMASTIYSPPQFANPTPGYSEDPFGDGWIPGINVVVGQVYLMYISNWDQTGLEFSMDWTLANGATLDCTLLQVELIAFNGHHENDGNLLQWRTATELNNDHFTLSRSTNMIDWAFVTEVQGVGTTQISTSYNFLDKTYPKALNYYRLEQTDNNGSNQDLGTITIDNSKEQYKVIKRTNYMGQEVDENYRGFYIEHRDHGDPIMGFR